MIAQSEAIMYSSKGCLTKTDQATLYLPLVKRIAGAIHKQINFMLELDDLIQIGTLGLLEALHKYTTKEGSTFETYAQIKIKGFILDELRKNDHLSQDDRTKYKTIQKSIKKLYNSQLSKPTDAEIAKESNLTLQEYFSVMQKNHSYSYVSNEEQNEELLNAPSEYNIEDSIQKKELLKNILSSIEKLNDQEKLIMQLIYAEDCQANEVAEIIGISKARVSQIHTSCISKLKLFLNKTS